MKTSVKIGMLHPPFNTALLNGYIWYGLYPMQWK